MIKLLKGDFIRLFKSKIFWLGMIFMIGLAAVAVHTKWEESHLLPHYDFPSDNIIFAGAMFIGIVIAVFIGIFVGTDYSNGTIRNKFINGHSRMSVYFSNLIVCVTASLMMHIVWLTVIFPAEKIGIMNKFSISYKQILALFLISLVSVTAFVSIFLMISMLITNRTIASVTVLILSFFLLLLTITIDNALHQPEYHEEYSYTTTVDGELQTKSLGIVKNPQYVDGVRREIYEFVYNYLPQGQIIQLENETVGIVAENSETDKTMFPLYSIALMVVTTTAGILVFRRKDLK